MNNQTVYWVWLQHALGFANKKILALTSKYTFAEEFYRAPLEEKLHCCGFSPQETKRLTDTSLDYAEGVVKRCAECGIEVVPLTDPHYPRLLTEIADPPTVLYVRGDVTSLNASMNIGMVGTRDATPYGKQAAQILAYGLAKSGVTVVSGGALGIDSCSHQGALNAGGTTICVMGCGLATGYLPQNRDLRNEIAKHGAVVSEYPPDFHSTKYTFPKRNRIISGMSRGVVVVEAGARSGSLITANIALEQNRDVFAVPGAINSSLSIGTNELIKSGARVATSSTDILNEYRYLVQGGEEDAVNAAKLSKMENDFAEQMTFDETSRGNANRSAYFTAFGQRQTKTTFDEPKKRSEQVSHGEVISPHNQAPQQQTAEIFEKYAAEKHTDDVNNASLPFSGETINALSENARTVLALFAENEKLHIDEVKRKSGLNIGSVHAAVTELELNELIVSLAGRMYELNRSNFSLKFG